MGGNNQKLANKSPAAPSARPTTSRAFQFPSTVCILDVTVGSNVTYVRVLDAISVRALDVGLQLVLSLLLVLQERIKYSLFKAANIAAFHVKQADSNSTNCLPFEIK